MPYVPTDDFVIGQLEILTASLPLNQSIYDIYFDLETSQWMTWQHLSEIT